ncbi:hypothetical protein GPK83_12170 [Clostridium sp. MCC328]|nr:hypothetical protein [Clostridium sp. MCC328]
MSFRRCPQQACGEENHKGIFFSAGRCVLTQALLAGSLIRRMQSRQQELRPLGQPISRKKKHKKAEHC